MRILMAVGLGLLFTSPVFATYVHVDDWAPQGPPSYYMSPVHHSPELHILGAYEFASTVHVQSGSAPLVLVCSSYKTVTWRFTIDPGANVQRIILNGYESQLITGAGSIPVTNLSPYTNGWLGAYGYAYPSAPGGSDTPLLIANAQAYTGLTLESFGGAYQPYAFTINVPEPAGLVPCVVLGMMLRRGTAIRQNAARPWR